MAQRGQLFDSTNFVLRTHGDPLALLPSLRGAVTGLDPAMPLEAVATMRSAYRDALAEPRFRGGLVAAFAGLALLLTAVGLYGLLSYAVGGRTREFGVRAALGAQPGQVMALVLGQAAWMVGVGLALGLAGAWAATRVLAGLLYGVSPTDPWVLAATTALLAAVALAAAWAPARRATTTDASLALRCD
ncbi:MAG: FtsX-like permease family protein [Terriglobales bacterium]